MRRLSTIIIACCACLHVLAAEGSDTVGHARSSALLRDYDYVLRADPWLSGCSPAALTRFATRDIARAEVSLAKGKGGFVDYSQSPDYLQADASVGSLFRLSPRTVVAGAISYDNFAGRDMAGSAFLQPGSRLPFDIVEDSLGNEGQKHRDTYRLSGAFGTDIGKGIALGARLDYTAANYAKYKDLRHKNKLMDLLLTTGVYLPVGSWGAVAANYLYRRTTESLQFSMYGKNDKVYQSLIAYAAFMGHREQFGYEGYTDKSREMPLVSNYNGFSVQFSALTAQRSPLAPQLSFYSDFTYARREGYYGRQSPYTITYTGHRSHCYDYRAQLALATGTSRHALDLVVSAENLVNEANTYREMQNEAGASYYQYYDPVKTANRLWVSTTIALTSDLGVHHELPLLTLRAGMHCTHRKQTAYLYPYYRRQDLTARHFFASASRSFVTSSGVWTCALSASLGNGSGEPFTDLTMQEPSDKQEPPATMEAYLLREYEFLTATRYSVGASAQYAFLLPGTAAKAHARVTLNHSKANGSTDHCLGCDQTQAAIAIGCTF